MVFSGQDLIYRINQIIEAKGVRRDPDIYNIVSSVTLSAWKNNGQIPKVNTIYNLAEFLGVSVEWLITGREADGLTQEERVLVAKYKDLSNDDKRNVQALIDSMLRN